MNITGRFNREIYKMNCSSLSVENQRAQLVNNKHIWEIPFNVANYEEDGDSSEDEDDSSDDEDRVIVLEGQSKTEKKLPAFHGLEYFITKEKEYLVKHAQKKQQRKKKQDLEVDLKVRLEELNISDDKVSKILAAQNSDSKDCVDDHKIDLDLNVLNAIEYIPIEEDCPAREKQQQYADEGYNEESDEDFSWLEELKDKDPVSLENDTYFTFINETRKPFKKGTQAWNCYGDRSNMFLLMNYGFCFEGNVYDSLKFMVRLDLSFSRLEEIEPRKIIPPKYILQETARAL